MLAVLGASALQSIGKPLAKLRAAPQGPQGAAIRLPVAGSILRGRQVYDGVVKGAAWQASGRANLSQALWCTTSAVAPAWAPLPLAARRNTAGPAPCSLNGTWHFSAPLLLVSLQSHSPVCSSSAVSQPVRALSFQVPFTMAFSARLTKRNVKAARSMGPAHRALVDVSAVASARPLRQAQVACRAEAEDAAPSSAFFTKISFLRSL